MQIQPTQPNPIDRVHRHVDVQIQPTSQATEMQRHVDMHIQPSQATECRDAKMLTTSVTHSKLNPRYRETDCGVPKATRD